MTLQRQREWDAEFAEQMAPYTAKIYQRVFPGAQILTARQAFGAAFVARGLHSLSAQLTEMLDRDFAIDKVLRLPGGETFTVQEKVRRNRFVRYMDFTQEYKNGADTPNEEPGEWFKLSAQLYFYGWANATDDGIKEWAIIDVVQYKRLVAGRGGLDRSV